MIKFLNKGGEYTPQDVELPIDYNAIYDTEEHQVGYLAVTGGYKPVYKRGFAQSITADQTVHFNLGITNLDKIVWYGGVYIDIYGTTFPLPSNSVPQNSTYTIGIQNIQPDQELYWNMGSNVRNNGTLYLNVKYTKTTDTVIIEIPNQVIPGIIQKYIDTVPVGTELDYDGEEVPSGWVEVDDPQEYSTSEQVIGKWIDGKPLYRKVVETTLPSSTHSWQTISTNVVTNLDTLAKLYGVFSMNGTEYHPIPMAEGEYFVNLEISSNDLRCTRNGWTNAPAKIIIEYTKTTDTIQGGNE